MSLVDAIVEADSLSESSKTQYLEKLSTLSKVMGKPLEYIVDNPERVRNCLRKRYSGALTQRAFIAAIKALFHYNPHLRDNRAEQYAKYSDYQNDMTQAVTDRYMAAEPSDKERENWVPWPEVQAKERELATAEFGSYDHLLLAMYCLIEPLRQDYGALRILVGREPSETASGNFLVINKDASWGKLVLNTYKTAKKYGTFQRVLPPDLMSVIRSSLVAHPRAYLFVDESGEPYRKSNSFTQFSNRTLRRLFGKKLTVSLLRHSHISSIDFNASTPGELFQKSRNMAHSISMQQMYRRKVEPAPPPPPLTVIKQGAALAPAVPAPAPAPAPTHAPAPAPALHSGGGLVVDKNGYRYLNLSI